MRINLLSIFLLIITITSTCHAQDNTQGGLPEGAIARLGKGGINAMKFSPDGNHLAVATEIGVWMYDGSSGKGMLLHTEGPDEITAVVFTSDGRKLVCGSGTNQTIQFWDLNTDIKKPYLTLYDRFVHVVDLVFSKDNKTLFSLSPYGYLTKWDLDTNKEISAIQFSENHSIAAFAYDGKAFVHGDSFVHGDPYDSSIRIWDIVDGIFSDAFVNGTNPKTLIGTQKDTDIQNGITELGISPDNNYIVSAHENNIIRLWDADTKTLIYSLKGHTASINSGAFSPDNKILATGGKDKTIMLWDVEKGNLHKTLTGHTNNIKKIEFSPTNLNILASGSSDGTIRFWDTQTGEELQILAKGHIDSIHDLAFSKDNKVLSSVTRDGAVQIWDINAGKTLPTPYVESLDIEFPLALSHDATILAYNGTKTNFGSSRLNNGIRSKPREGIKLWILPLGEQLDVYQQKTLLLTFSPDNKMLAFSNVFSGVKIWNIETQTEIFSANKEFSHPTHMKFSSNGKLLVVNDAFSDTEVWDIAAQRNISPPNIEDVNVAAFSPDCSMLALKHSDYIDLWQINSTGMKYNRRITPNGNLGTSELMVFSPDGKMLLDVIGMGKSANIQIWDLDSGNLSGTLIGHLNAISKLLFSHDGKMLASGSIDGIILLWNWQKISQNITKNKESTK